MSARLQRSLRSRAENKDDISVVESVFVAGSEFISYPLGDTRLSQSLRTEDRPKSEKKKVRKTNNLNYFEEEKENNEASCSSSSVPINKFKAVQLKAKKKKCASTLPKIEHLSTKKRKLAGSLEKLDTRKISPKQLETPKQSETSKSSNRNSSNLSDDVFASDTEVYLEESAMKPLKSSLKCGKNVETLHELEPIPKMNRKSSKAISFSLVNDVFESPENGTNKVGSFTKKPLTPGYALSSKSKKNTRPKSEANISKTLFQNCFGLEDQLEWDNNVTDDNDENETPLSETKRKSVKILKNAEPKNMLRSSKLSMQAKVETETLECNRNDCIEQITISGTYVDEKNDTSTEDLSETSLDIKINQNRKQSSSTLSLLDLKSNDVFHRKSSMLDNLNITNRYSSTSQKSSASSSEKGSESCFITLRKPYKAHYDSVDLQVSKLDEKVNSNDLTIKIPEGNSKSNNIFEVVKKKSNVEKISNIKDSILLQDNASPLVRQSTFTKDEAKVEVPAKTTSRKRWDEVPRTPVFDSKLKPVQSQNSNFQSSIFNKNDKSIFGEPSSSQTQTITLFNSPSKKKWKPPVTAEASRYATNEKVFDITDHPSHTSTPFSTQKPLKPSVPSEKKIQKLGPIFNTKKVNMPDFTKIHQRAFEKMESIKEMQERKAMRAKILLSGSRAPQPSTSQNRNENPIKKQLDFNKIKDNSKDKSKSRSPSLLVSHKKRCSLTRKQVQRSKIPITNKPVKSKAAPQDAKRPEQTTVAASKPRRKLISEKKDIKDLKIKPITEKNRTAIRGYRSNRRFELLMQMREKEK